MQGAFVRSHRHKSGHCSMPPGRIPSHLTTAIIWKTSAATLSVLITEHTRVQRRASSVTSPPLLYNGLVALNAVGTGLGKERKFQHPSSRPENICYLSCVRVKKRRKTLEWLQIRFPIPKTLKLIILLVYLNINQDSPSFQHTTIDIQRLTLHNSVP